MHKCVKQNIIVHFNIQKLKNQHTFLKKYTNWAKLSSLFWQNELVLGLAYFLKWFLVVCRKVINLYLWLSGGNVTEI